MIPGDVLLTFVWLEALSQRRPSSADRFIFTWKRACIVIVFINALLPISLCHLLKLVEPLRILDESNLRVHLFHQCPLDLVVKSSPRTLAPQFRWQEFPEISQSLVQICGLFRVPCPWSGFVFLLQVWWDRTLRSHWACTRCWPIDLQRLTVQSWGPCRHTTAKMRKVPSRTSPGHIDCSSHHLRHGHCQLHRGLSISGGDAERVIPNLFFAFGSLVMLSGF